MDPYVLVWPIMLFFCPELVVSALNSHTGL